MADVKPGEKEHAVSVKWRLGRLFSTPKCAGWHLIFRSFSFPGSSSAGFVLP